MLLSVSYWFILLVERKINCLKFYIKIKILVDFGVFKVRIVGLLMSIVSVF